MIVVPILARRAVQFRLKQDSWIKHEGYAQRCLPLLEGLMDDDDPEVRREACSVFRNEERLGIDGLPELARVWMGSRAFEDGLQTFVLGLDEYAGGLEPFSAPVLKAAAAVCEGVEVRTGGGDVTFYEVRELSKVVLRLYEQSQDSRNTEVQRACLDALDGMLKARVRDVYSLIEGIDS